MSIDARPRVDLALLLERLERLEAAEHARGALAAYADAIDARDLDALAAVFDVDAVLEVPGALYPGREQILGFYSDAFATDPSHKRHFVTNVSTTGLDSGRVRLRCYLLYTAAAEDVSVIGWGDYEAVVRVESPTEVIEGTRVIERLTIAIHRSVDVRDGWAGTPGSADR